MKQFIVFATLLLTLGASGTALARDVGYVDMKRVLTESRKGKEVQERIRSQFEGRRQALLAEVRSIGEALKNLQRDAAIMSREQATKKQEALKQRIVEYQKKGRALPASLSGPKPTATASEGGAARAVRVTQYLHWL